MLINTNARSLCPKLDSLIDCVDELGVDIAIVTETWFKSGPELEQQLSDPELGFGLKALTLDRDPNPTTGVSHGGVAVFYKKKIDSFKVILDYPNPEKFEVLPVVGTILGTSRKVVVIAAYLPPNYTVPRGRSCLEHLENLLIEVKRRFNDPYIVLAGDYNQWPAEDAVAEFPDVSEVIVGPTRGDRSIDRIFCNMLRSVTSSGMVPPLDSGHSTSDHKIAYVKIKIQRQQTYEWLTYTIQSLYGGGQEGLWDVAGYPELDRRLVRLWARCQSPGLSGPHRRCHGHFLSLAYDSPQVHGSPVAE